MLVETGQQPKQQKKLVIKGFASRPKLPESFEKDTWEKLEAAVHAVQLAQPVDSSLEELYQAVESMCSHKLSASLYERLKSVCDAHIRSSLLAQVEHLSKGTTAFLKYMDACWSQHCRQMLLIRSIFLYLDRCYVLTQPDVEVSSIFDMGLQQFRCHLAAQPQVEATVVSGVLEMIRGDRAKDAVDRTLLKSMVRMLLDLSIYDATFLAPFLHDSEILYGQEGLDLCTSLSVPAYLLHCETRLAEEHDRCVEYLEPSTSKALIEVVEQQLLVRHFEGLLDRGFPEMMKEQRLEDLARMYTLAGRVKFEDKLRLCFRDWIKATGMALVTDTEKDPTLIQSLLELKDSTSAVLAGPFKGNPAFGKALRDAFENLINQREHKPAELIAKYVDARMKEGSKTMTDAQLEEDLEKALVLFRYIQGKDVFEAFYKKDFAKRLLMAKSASVDVEKSMIAKLKAECGAQYTSKLEGMFKDEQVSRDIQAAFKASSEHQAQLPKRLDVAVRVLTSGFWPTYPATTINLPAELATAVSVFQEYYLGKYGGRRLNWYTCLDTCSLRAHFPKHANQPKELAVSLHQAVCLLLFNGASSFSLADIAAATGLPTAELHRTLQSLACGKVRVLTKEPKGKDVGEGDVFHFNADFTSGRHRIRINQIQLTETVEESKKTNEQVMQDRAVVIDAAIVRIMKTRKSLSHKLLIQEVMLQLKFTVKGSDLKKRIESLIEREFIERSSENRDVYVYLA